MRARLIEAAEDETSSADVVWRAVLALGGIGATELSLESLRSALRHTEVRVREGACEALGDMGSAARPVVEDLVGLLGDQRESPGVRGEAAFALGRIGGPEAAAALAAGLDEEDMWVRYQSAQGLAYTQPSKGAPLLAQCASAFVASPSVLRDEAGAVEGDRAVAELVLRDTIPRM